MAAFLLRLTPRREIDPDLENTEKNENLNVLQIEEEVHTFEKHFQQTNDEKLSAKRWDTEADPELEKKYLKDDEQEEYLSMEDPKRIRLQEKQKTYKCMHCPNVCSSSTGSKIHKECHIESSLKIYKCENCSASYQRKEDLTKHNKIHKMIKTCFAKL